MIYAHDRALELLRLGTGNEQAQFRNGQDEAIRWAVERGSRLLVVKKTGWGKSFVYFIAARMIREWGMKHGDIPGPILLISPLLGLMRDQVRNARKMGVRAHYISSENKDEWEDIEKAVKDDYTCDILLITPERLGDERFSENILTEIAGRMPMLVVDEAHCLSDWGHDFRPDYRRIENLVQKLPRTTRLLATTATANERVKQDLRSYLGNGMKEIKGDLGRPSLLLQTIRLPRPEQRLAWLADRLHEIEGSGIIYASTKKDVQQVTYWLQQNGFAVEAYSGDTDRAHPGLRRRLEDDLLSNRVKALVATIALGIGFDKPDLAFVIHYQRPGTVVGYYQQVGRAGRALPTAHAVLLCGAEDSQITDYFIRTAFPSPEQVQKIVTALSEAARPTKPWQKALGTQSQPAGLYLWELAQRTGISRKYLGNWMNILATEQPAPFVRVSKEGMGGGVGPVVTRHISAQGGRDLWVATGEPVDESFWIRAERVLAQRRKELEQMEDYARLRSGHMQFLVRALDGRLEEYKSPDLAPLPETVDHESMRQATQLVKRWGYELRPRRRWEWPGLAFIPENRQAEAGETLCNLYRGEHGRAVKDGLSAAQFSDRLVQASAWRIRKWGTLRNVAWATYIPSAVQSESERTRDFAKRLAQTLRLPFLHSLESTWNRDIGRPLHRNEMYLEFLVTAPEDANLVIWRDELKHKPKYDPKSLFTADRIVVHCRPGHEARARSFLQSLARQHYWSGPTTVWRFDGEGQSGNIAVMMFPGKAMPWHTSLNSLGQAISCSDSLETIEESVAAGPVLLIHDLVEHGWSFAYAADKLREAGCQAVFPFALARTGKW